MTIRDHHTEATRRLGIAHPIVQGPFGGGLSTVALASTVSNLGGLGSYGAHQVPPDRIGETVAALRAHTTRPFALNLWVSDHDPGGEQLTGAEEARMRALFAPYFAELGIAQPPLPTRFHPSFAAQIEALLEARPPVFSFVFGIPEPRVLEECRRRHILTVGTATSIAEARALDEAGVDAIVATGAEAGGHRPCFLARSEDSLVGTLALVPLVVDRVRVPVIAAGGIADRRGVHAVLALGAGAAQLGTAFLACSESGTTEAHRSLLFGEASERTVLTRAFTGRLARGLVNRWTTELDARTSELAPFPAQSWFVSQLRAAAAAAGRTDVLSLWAGQIAPNLKHRTTTRLMTALLEEDS